MLSARGQREFGTLKSLKDAADVLDRCKKTSLEAQASLRRERCGRRRAAAGSARAGRCSRAALDSTAIRDLRTMPQDLLRDFKGARTAAAGPARAAPRAAAGTPRRAAAQLRQAQLSQRASDRLLLTVLALEEETGAQQPDPHEPPAARLRGGGDGEPQGPAAVRPEQAARPDARGTAPASGVGGGAAGGPGGGGTPPPCCGEDDTLLGLIMLLNGGKEEGEEEEEPGSGEQPADGDGDEGPGGPAGGGGGAAQGPRRQPARGQPPPGAPRGPGDPVSAAWRGFYGAWGDRPASIIQVGAGLRMGLSPSRWWMGIKDFAGMLA
jgi:hypothetical protein